MESHESKEDIKSLSSKCRVCLQICKVMYSLFEARKLSGIPANILKGYCGMKISRGDGGPAFICSGCLQELDFASTFLLKCQRAQIYLNKTLGLDLLNESEFTEDKTLIKEEIKQLERIRLNPASSPDISVGSEFSDSEKEIKTVIIKEEPKRKKLSPKPSTDIKCDVCGKKFNYNRSLYNHRRIHSKVVPYNCKQCGKGFHHKTNYDLHLKRHLNFRPFSCDICGAQRYTAKEVKYHMRVHTGEKPFECTVCEKRFTSNSNLKIHLRIHTGEKPAECPYCGKKFISNDVLNVHKRLHTGEKPYVCSVCGKRFTSNKLKVHMTTHTGEKNYTCATCGRSFGTRGSLKSHILTHDEGKLYECGQCGNTYRHPHSLRKHLKKKHAEEQETNLNDEEPDYVEIVVKAE